MLTPLRLIDEAGVDSGVSGDEADGDDVDIAAYTIHKKHKRVLRC
jgi:hypothetical protein